MRTDRTERGFAALKELLNKTELVEPSTSELEQKVRKVFKRSIDRMKSNGDRPTLNVGKKFLQGYYREHRMEGMKDLLSKISLLVDNEGLNYLIEIGIVKKKL